jgi:hypothetical protein
LFSGLVQAPHPLLAPVAYTRFRVIAIPDFCLTHNHAPYKKVKESFVYFDRDVRVFRYNFEFPF